MNIDINDFKEFDVSKTKTTVTTEAQRRAKKKYDKATAKGIYLKLNIYSDADILEHLESIGPDKGGKQGYIKSLIRQDMKQSK